MSNDNGNGNGVAKTPVDFGASDFAIIGIERVEPPQYVLGFWCPRHERFEGTGETFGTLDAASKAATDMFGRLAEGGASDAYLIALVLAKIGDKGMAVAVAQATTVAVDQSPSSIITPGS